MQLLAFQLVADRFRPAGVAAQERAFCIVTHESSWNPGARNSASTAIGLFQEEPQFHHDPLLAPLDPVYSVEAAWRISKHGRDFWTDWLRFATYRC